MNITFKVVAVAAIFVAALGSISIYENVGSLTDEDNSIGEVPSQNTKSTWFPIIKGLPQFSTTQENESLGDSADVNAENNYSIDTNDIGTTKLIGLLPDDGGLAILLVPELDSTQQSIIYKTVNLRVGETILDGWSLDNVGETFASWTHLNTDQKHTHFIFKLNEEEKTLN